MAYDSRLRALAARTRKPDMTMLDRMRRRKNILKWLLAAVVVGLSLYLIPVDWLQTQTTTVGALPARNRGQRGRARASRRRVPAALRRADAGVPAAVRRLDERAAAAAARRRSAGARADGGRAGGRARGRAPGHPRQRRRARAAHLRHPRPAGERPFHRRSTLRAAAAPAAAAAHEGAVRGQASAAASWWNACERPSPTGWRCPTPSSKPNTASATRR